MLKQLIGADPYFMVIVTLGMLFMFAMAGYLTWFFMKKSKESKK